MWINVCSSRVYPPSADSTTHLKFMRMLSQYYQGLDCLDPLPYYEPQATVSTDIPSTTRLPQPFYDPSVLPLPWDDPSICPPSSLFTFRLTKEQYEDIHQHITEFSNTLDEPVRLSRLDVLVGMIAQAHTASDPKNPPISKVMHMINVSTLTPDATPSRHSQSYLATGDGHHARRFCV